MIYYSDTYIRICVAFREMYDVLNGYATTEEVSSEYYDFSEESDEAWLEHYHELLTFLNW